MEIEKEDNKIKKIQNVLRLIVSLLQHSDRCATINYIYEYKSYLVSYILQNDFEGILDIVQTSKQEVQLLNDFHWNEKLFNQYSILSAVRMASRYDIITFIFILQVRFITFFRTSYHIIILQNFSMKAKLVGMK